ncbi:MULTISPECIES: hypothetical protein [Natrialbaceae]|uniref:hypothetical protein n=1 Tax=Natrialbaceae TaxID=1644061 RepID=UPI00207D3C80|nr:hypothetical protein [Natronococcus sp. CG52]
MTAASGSSARRRLLLGSGSLATLCLGDDGSDESESVDEDGLDGDTEEADFGDALANEFDEADHEVDVSEPPVYDRESNEPIANSHTGRWHCETETGGLPAIELETVFTKDGDELPLGADETYRLDVVVADEADDAVVDIDAEPAHVSLSGEEAGETAVLFRLPEGGKIVREAPLSDTLVKE